MRLRGNTSNNINERQERLFKILGKSSSNKNTTISRYIDRVVSDGGTVEGTMCLLDYLKRNPQLLNASYLVIPSGYKAGTLYPILPNDNASNLSSVRGTTANRTNRELLLESMAINVPRLDYQTSACPSVLVEPAATNLLLRSEEFNDAYWTKGAGGVASAPVVTENAEISPDGTMNADRVVFNLNGGTLAADLSQLESALITHAAAAHTRSIYARTTDGSTRVFNFVSPSGFGQLITITPNWQRFTATNSAAGAGTFRLRLRGTEGTASSATIALYGAQYEAGELATSYIPTGAATKTRNADSITITPASGLIGQTEGTIYWDIASVSGIPTSTGNPQFGVRNAPLTNWIGLTSNLPANPFRITVRATTGILIDYSANITSGKAAVAYSSAGAVLYVNGVQVGTSATNPNFSFDRFDIIGLMVFRANAAALFITRLTNAELASMTVL